MENDKIKWILDEFSRTDNTYKRKAVDSAMELREAITPHLLGILEEARADPAKYAEESFAHIYAVTLLYYFREAKAHPGMVKLFSLPGDWTYRLFGEVWLEQAPYFLYGTCGDSLETLTALVCNSDIDDVYCRVGAVMAMVYAALDEEEKRAPVLEFFKSFLKDLISKYVDKNGERRVSFSADDMELVTLLIDNSMRLHPEEIKEEILRAFEIGLADTSIVEQADFEEILTIEKEPYLKRESTLVRNGMGIDIHSIMGWVYDTEEFKGLYDEATIETQGIGNSTITNLEKINWILKEF
ncbi:MAG: DUF1186 domain-containing protein, partial [bacterium]|nr:DUF1186 domain-containing protein [bacterium]